jgi:Mrp family chromosome partitioning ATPase
MILAQASALGGERTLLVDADVRRQSASNLLSMGSSNFRIDEERGYDILKLRQPMGDKVFAFKSNEILEKVHAADRNYQTIVIDAPPAFCLSEIVGMVQSADAVVLACRWNSTPAGALSQTARNLQSLGAKVKGIVLTVVDFERQADMTFHSANYSLQQAMGHYFEDASPRPGISAKIKGGSSASMEWCRSAIPRKLRKLRDAVRNTGVANR